MRNKVVVCRVSDEEAAIIDKAAQKEMRTRGSFVAKAAVDAAREAVNDL